MNISALYATMVLLLCALASGFVARKTKVVDETFVPNFSKLILNVFQPCMIVSSVLNKEHLLSNGAVIQLTFIALGCYAALIGLSYLVLPFLRIKTDKNIYRFMFVFSNVGFMGYPVVRSLFGDDAMFNVTIFIMLFQLIIYTFGIFFLSGDYGHIRPSKKMLAKPAIIAAIASYILYFFLPAVPETLATAAGYIGDLTTPTSMILIGCSLATVPYRQMLGTPKIYGFLAIKMILVPLAFYGILQFFITDALVLGVITALMAMPVATNSTMLSVVYGGNDKAASTAVLISTVCSVATIPLLLQFLFH